MLDGHELVTERCRLVEGLVEDAAETRAGLRLRRAAGDGRLLGEPRLGLGAQGVDARTRPLHERARELLVEQRDRQVIGGQLGVADPPRELLCARDGLAALDRQLVEIHLTLLVSREAVAAGTARLPAG